MNEEEVTKEELKEYLNKARKKCPSCGEDDTMFWCCECLRKSGIKAKDELIQEIDPYIMKLLRLLREDNAVLIDNLSTEKAHDLKKQIAEAKSLLRKWETIKDKYVIKEFDKK